MNLLQRIIECNEEEIDSIINEVIKENNEKATKISQLGFIEYGNLISVHKGFIPLNTRIKYSKMNIEDYGMETTDFIYLFAHFIKKNNLNNPSSLINSLVYFSNLYFGFPSNINREEIFNDRAFQSTKTDEEYFKALENNKLGDLKGTGAALCTERGALVQQILSIFGFETYYCMGCIEHNDHEEAHCFNIVKANNSYVLLDCSVPINSYIDNKVNTNYPFMGKLTEEEFMDFINNGTVKEFDDYCINNKQRKRLDTKRKYIVGKYECIKEKDK